MMLIRLSKVIWLALSAVIGIALAQVGVWAFDRDPPYKLLSVDPAISRRGEYVDLTAHVWRDVHRGCAAEFVRFLYTSAGYRVDMEGAQFISARNLEQMERRDPGMLRLKLFVPVMMVAGRTKLVTEIRYICNPLHHLWPIEVTTTMPFDVLP